MDVESANSLDFNSEYYFLGRLRSGVILSSESYLSSMKQFLAICCISLALIGCGDSATTTDSVDTAKAIPDSVPQMVRLGKEADWPYKPDSMINELLLADAESMREYKRINGNEGEKADENENSMVYVNTLETEQLTVWETKVGENFMCTGFRVKKNLRDRNSPPASNYALARNFLTSAGIYIGMPADYVQTIYKSQGMMRWVKGDTTYLGYSPLEKDKQHYKRYSFDAYSAIYKFKNDACVVMEVWVDPEKITQ
jgi:hypothetical protein